ncbi:MAG: restriction endonuclease subunit S, partial [Saprospiraceae bacterium]
WESGDGVISHKSKFSKNDILFGKLRPYFHKVGIAAVDGVCSTDILVIQPKSPEWFGFCLCHFSSGELISFASSVADGTRMPRTSWKDISNFEVAIPPKEIAGKFSKVIQPMLEQIHANIYQTRTLTHLRDSLLPKLMRGEIEVPMEDQM